MVKLLREFIDAVLQEGKNELEVVHQRSMSSVVNSTIDHAIKTLKAELAPNKESNVEAGALERSLGRFRFFYLDEWMDDSGALVPLSIGVHVSYGHNGTKLFDPDVGVQAWGGGKFIKQERALESRLKGLLGPVPATTGLWWSDENMYLKRPLFFGESPTLPPKKGWKAIDSVTYEPWDSKVKRRDK